jgi:hypothetical protein
MKNYFYIILFVFFLSCESRTNYKKPKDLIPQDVMVNLLIDMHLVNGITGIKSKNDMKANDYMSVLYEKYQIDSTRFAASNLYYVSNISEYESMFKKVETKIGEQKILMEDDSIIKPELMKKKLKRPSIKKRNKDSNLK